MEQVKDIALLALLALLVLGGSFLFFTIRGDHKKGGGKS